MIEKILGKDIGKYVRKHKKLMICSIIPAIITSLLSLIPVIITQTFLDDGMMKSSIAMSSAVSTEEETLGKSSSFVLKLLTDYNLIDNPTPTMIMIMSGIIIIISVFFISITTSISELAAAAYSNRAIKDIRIDLHKKFMSLHQGFYHKNKAGSLLSRSTVDLTVMQNSISSITIGLVQCPLLILCFTAFLLYKDYKLTLIVFAAVPVIFWLIRLFGRKLKKHSTRVQDANADVSTVYQETLLCLKLIQGLSIEENRSLKFQNAADFLYKKTMHWNRWLRGMGPMMDFTIIIVLSVILIVGILVFNHSIGSMIAMFMAFKGVYSPVKNLAKTHNELKTLQGATERVFGIINAEPEIKENPSAIVLPRHSKYIEFRKVYFSYNRDTPIVKDISFTINRGEMVAFVGSTGAGKSTLMDLIPRFYDPLEGSILVDGIDIRDVTLNSLRRQIGIVSQEVLLFHDTIYNNINCSSYDIDKKEIIEAAKAAHAHDFIMAQPNQYDTVVGDRGTLLSGGQKQRISIARAILTNPSILLLDEVASALDAESEELIQKSIESMKGKCTIFVIAHRLSTIRNADRIFVLEKGEIIESGTPEELMDINGRFRQLHDMQYQL